MSRRAFLRRSAALAAVAAAGRPSASAAQGKRTFRWAFNAAETGFDPAQVSDLYSNYDALGVRSQFKVNQWPENMKAARAGKLMFWMLGWSAGSPDPDGFLALGSSRDIGGSNIARFRLAEYDRLYDRQRQIADGPERLALIHEMKRLFNAYMPYKVHGHRYSTDLVHPWLIGFRRHPFARDIFKYVDIDPAGREAA